MPNILFECNHLLKFIDLLRLTSSAEIDKINASSQKHQSCYKCHSIYHILRVSVVCSGAAG